MVVYLCRFTLIRTPSWNKKRSKIMHDALMLFFWGGGGGAGGVEEMSGYFLTHDFSPQTINLIMCVCVCVSFRR